MRIFYPGLVVGFWMQFYHYWNVSQSCTMDEYQCKICIRLCAYDLRSC